MKQHERFFKSAYAVSLSLILVLLSAISAFAEPEFYTGYVPPEEPWAISTPKRTRREVLPLSFDAREKKPQLNPNFKLPPIRNQHSTGTCWAHGTLACVESYLGGTNNFSEGHMAYNINDDINLGTGGNANYACQYFSNLVGPITEKDYDGYDGELDNNFTQPGSIPRQWFKPGRYTLMGDVNKKLHESYVGDMIAISAKEEEIKKYVYNYGIVAASYYVPSESGKNADPYYDGNQNSPSLNGYRYTDDTQPNHMIAIVGWDDNKKITTKSGSYVGAYLVRNSWGENWGNNGYFWMSYDTLKEQFWSTKQNKFFDNNAFVFTNIKEKKANIYTDYPKYPLDSRGFNDKNSVTYASRYNRDRAKNEVVTDIAIYNPNPGNTTYKLYFSENDTITDGTGIEKDDKLLKESTFDHSGYYTLEIDEDRQPLLTKDKFTIKAVVTNTGNQTWASTPTNKKSLNKTYIFNGSSFVDLSNGGMFILYTKDAPNATYKADIQLKDKNDADLTDDTETGGFKFTDKEEGYEAITAKELVIANTGTGDLLNTVVTLTGTNAENFTITKPSQSTIIKDQSVTFTVKPNDGLTAGTYTAKVKVTADNMTPVEKTVTFTVKEKNLVEVTAIDIKEHIQNKIYNPGDTLNLSGLVVTLTKSDGSKQNVPLSDFSQNNITTSIADGAKLTGRETEIVITYSKGNINLSVEEYITMRPSVYTTGVEIKHEINKKNYHENEKLDLTGLVVLLKRSDGNDIEVPLSKFAKNNISTKPANGTPLKKTDNQVSIICKYYDGTVNTTFVIQSIFVHVGELSPDGKDFGVVEEGYSPIDPVTFKINNTGTWDLDNVQISLEGTNKDSFQMTSPTETTIPMYKNAELSVKPKDNLPAGTYTAQIKITADYMTEITKEIKFTVTAKPVIPAKVTDITVKTQPAKITYTEEETLDLTGLEVTLEYDNGQTRVVKFADFGANNITTDPSNGAKLAVANKKVTITYNDGAVTKTVDQAITVNAKPVAKVTGITIETPPTKVTYTEDETLDLKGLEVTLEYDNGQTRVVKFADFGANNITTDPSNGAKLAVANNKVTITYNDGTYVKMTEQAITVNAKSSSGSGVGSAKSHDRKDRNKPKKEPKEEPKKEEPKKEVPTPVAPVSLPFVDVNKPDWFYNAVSYVYTNGLMNGMDETTFAPNDNTTRAMVAQVLYNISGKPETSMNYSMKDVTSSDWYKDSVSWAVNNKIAAGVSPDMFGANQPITREQMVTMLYNYAKYEGFDVSAQADLTAYSDSYMVSPYANKAFRWAIASNIISGMGNNDLSPQGFTTRAQLAVMLKAYKGL